MHSIATNTSNYKNIIQKLFHVQFKEYQRILIFQMKKIAFSTFAVLTVSKYVQPTADYTPKCIDSWFDGQSCVCREGMKVEKGKCVPDCGENEKWNGFNCQCLKGFNRFDGINCIKCEKNSHYEPDTNQCLCNEGYKFKKGACVLISNKKNTYNEQPLTSNEYEQEIQQNEQNYNNGEENYNYQEQPIELEQNYQEEQPYYQQEQDYQEQQPYYQEQNYQEEVVQQEKYPPQKKKNIRSEETYEDYAPEQTYEDYAPEQTYEDYAPEQTYEDYAPKQTYEDYAPKQTYQTAPQNYEVQYQGEYSPQSQGYQTPQGEVNEYYNTDESGQQTPFCGDFAQFDGQGCICIKGYTLFNDECAPCPVESSYDCATKTCKCDHLSFYEPTTNECVSCGKNQKFSTSKQTCVCQKGFKRYDGNSCRLCPLNSKFDSKLNLCKCNEGRIWTGTKCVLQNY